MQPAVAAGRVLAAAERTGVHVDLGNRRIALVMIKILLKVSQDSDVLVVELLQIVSGKQKLIRGLNFMIARD